MPALRPITLAWLLSRTRVSEEGCWVWDGRPATTGYAMVSEHSYPVLLHRKMAELVFGPLPPKAVVMHLCDNPPCLNPKHLRVGTQADNVRDMFAKGRDGRTVQPPSRYPRGSRVGTARLNEDQAATIKERLRAGVSARRVAGEFGVSKTTIQDIARGRSWKHVA